MVLILIGFISALLGSAALYIFTGWYQEIANLWMPFVFTLGFFILFFILFVLFFAVASLILHKKKEVKKPNMFFNLCMRQTAQLLMFFGNIKVHVNNKELMPKNDKNHRMMIISNHISNFDHLSIMAAFANYPLASISKPEMEKVPVIGTTQHYAGFIPIDRTNPMKAVKAVLQAASFIDKGYTNIVVAPEGTRSKSGVMGEFHPLTFKIPYKTGCPLVVMSIKGSNEVKKNSPWRRTHIYLDILKVYQKEEYEKISASELAEITHDLIKNHLGH